MLEQIAKDIADSVKKSVTAAVAKLKFEIDKRFEEVQGGMITRELLESAIQAGVSNSETKVKALIEEAVAALPKPKDGENGTSVDLADVKPLVDAAVKAAVDELPKPKDGDPGENVDPEVVKSMVEEAVAARIADIPKPKDGEDGTSVDPETVKAMVNEAVAAIPPAKDGESVSVEQVEAMLHDTVKEAVAGIQIPKPEDGRDALDIEIMSAIDETKSYPRGTYATHRGGLWKSFKKTQAMNGWECIVDGVFKTVVVKEKERSFSFITERASGAISKLPFEIEGMSYKKIYRDGQEYDKGDTVTWAGSLWHCNKKTTDKPGEGSEDWTLAAKKGRDHNPKIKV